MKLEVNRELLQKLAKKGSSLVLAGSILLSSPTILPIDNNKVYAASSNEEIVNLNVQTGINLYMNDKGFIPKDEQGNETYPFIYDGTTYVPIRAIAELFNANINWNEKTNTVSINTTGESAKLTHTTRYRQELTNRTISASKGTKLVINGNEVIPKDVNGNIKDIYVVNGTTYVPVRAVSEALGLPITWSDITNSVFIGKHKSTDLTVENITDPEYFNKCCRDLIAYNGGPLDCGYIYQDNVYQLKSEMNHEDLYPVYPPELLLFLLNREYCTEEVTKKIFDDYDLYDLNRGTNFVYTYIIMFMWKEYTNFQWNKYVIDQDKANFLKQFENTLKTTPNHNNDFEGNFDQINKLIDDYFYNKTTLFTYGNDYAVDVQVLRYATYSIRNLDNSRSDYNDLSDALYPLWMEAKGYLKETFNTVKGEELAK